MAGLIPLEWNARLGGDLLKILASVRIYSQTAFYPIRLNYPFGSIGFLFYLFVFLSSLIFLVFSFKVSSVHLVLSKQGFAPPH